MSSMPGIYSGENTLEMEILYTLREINVSFLQKRSSLFCKEVSSHKNLVVQVLGSIALGGKLLV